MTQQIDQNRATETSFPDTPPTVPLRHPNLTNRLPSLFYISL